MNDELAHAELSHAVFVDAGGDGFPHIDRESLGLSRTRAPLGHDVLRHGVSVFCLGETVAVRLFRRLRSGSTVPSARRALDRILKDEVRHRDFAWTLREWLLQGASSGALRGILDAELAAMIRRVERSYCGAHAKRRESGEDDVPAFSGTDRSWGLMPEAEYAVALRETLSRDYMPRFAELGVHVR